MEQPKVRLTMVARIAVEMDYPTLILALALELHLPPRLRGPHPFVALTLLPTTTVISFTVIWG